MLDVATVADRLSQALALLADEPDLDLLLRAEALATQIERRLAQSVGRAEREHWLAKAVAALASLDPIDDIGSVDLAGVDTTSLREIAEAAEPIPSARQAEVAARAARARTIDGTRAERRSAETMLDEAEDRLTEAKERLALVLEQAEKVDATAAVEDRGGGAEPEDMLRADEHDHSLTPANLVAPAESAPDPVVSEPIPAMPTTSAPVQLSDDAPPPDQAEIKVERGDGEDYGSPDADESEPATPATPAAPAGKWNSWIATALSHHRVGLAFHLAAARDLAGGSAGALPAAVLESVVHGRATRAAYDGAWRRYDDLRDQLVNAARLIGSSTAGQACALLLMAGAVRPALVQSQAALDVLEALTGDVAARLNPVVRLLSDMRAANVQSLDELAAPAGVEERRRRTTATKGALASWRAEAPRRKTGYQPATLIWQTLVAPQGPIGGVVQAILGGSADAADDARALIGRLRDRGEAEQLIVDTDEGRSGRRHNPIQGPALRQLINLCAGVADLMDDWLRAEGGAAAGGVTATGRGAHRCWSSCAGRSPPRSARRRPTPACLAPRACSRRWSKSCAPSWTAAPRHRRGRRKTNWRCCPPSR